MGSSRGPDRPYSTEEKIIVVLLCIFAVGALFETRKLVKGYQTSLAIKERKCRELKGLFIRSSGICMKPGPSINLE